MSKITLFFCAISLTVLSACSLPVTQTGDVPADIRINAIKPGKHKKEDVTRLIGSPASITLFEKESWIYVESKEKKRAFLPEKEFERKVVVFTFKPDSTVEKVTRYTLADGIDVPYEKDKTKTYGKDLNVWEEMIGNFGRFPASKSQGR